MKLFWRKRNDDFEWREYVRTTILVRRKERRQKVENAKVAAVQGLKESGRKSAEIMAAGVDAARRGSAAGGWWLGRKSYQLAVVSYAMLVKGARALALASAHGASRLWDIVGPLLRRFGAWIGERTEPLQEALEQPGIRLPVILIGWIAAAGATFRSATHGFDSEAGFATAIALFAVLLTLGLRGLRSKGSGAVARIAKYLDRTGERVVLLPGFERLNARPALVAVLAILAGIIYGGWILSRGNLNLGRIGAIPLLGSPPLEGAAVAVSGDTLRVAGAFVHLAGIEAPERAQECLKSGAKRWPCGSLAREALARAVRGRTITCKLFGSETNGAQSGRCLAGKEDIAASLVSAGHVFAETGIFARYGRLESEARDKKSGIWSGEVVRPSEWRAKKWEDAKREAPDGCPIKGRVSASGRVYLLPWSPAYDRARISVARGERWFCSEKDARAAGWQPDTPS